MLKIDSFKLGVDEKVKMPDVTIIYDIVRRMSVEIAKRVDQTFFDIAKLYGYSKEWLLDPANSNRIRVYEEVNVPGGSKRVIYIDDGALFEVFNYMDFESSKIEVGYKLLKEVKENDQN